MKKYENRQPLRQAAKQALEGRGFAVEPQKGTSGARLHVTNGSSSFTIHVRTSSDRWLGWMRDDEGRLRGMQEADLIVVAALSGRNAAEVLSFKPADVQKALEDNLAARLSFNKGLKKTAPIFVSLDPVDPERGPPAVGSDLKSKALWRVEVPLGAVPAEPILTRSPQGSSESFVERVRREFAQRMGVPVEKVSVEFKVSA